MNAKTKKNLMWVFILVLLAVAAYYGYNQWKKKNSSVNPSQPVTPGDILGGSQVAGPAVPVVQNTQQPVSTSPTPVFVQPKTGVTAYKKSNNPYVATIGNGVQQAPGL